MVEALTSGALATVAGMSDTPTTTEATREELIESALERIMRDPALSSLIHEVAPSAAQLADSALRTSDWRTRWGMATRDGDDLVDAGVAHLRLLVEGGLVDDAGQLSAAATLLGLTVNRAGHRDILGDEPRQKIGAELDRLAGLQGLRNRDRFRFTDWGIGRAL